MGACSREGRSNFSARQIAGIIDASLTVRSAPDRIDQLLEQGAASERSDLYRTMWDHLQPAFEASAAD